MSAGYPDPMWYSAMTPRARSLRLGAWLALCASLALTGCASGEDEPASTDDPEASEETPMADPAPENLVGTWSSDEPGDPYLEFQSDGTVRGTDGCNRISTVMTLDGERIMIEKAASTLRACQGVDDWLRGVREVSVDGDTMTVLDGSGAELGVLTRSDG